MNLSVDRNIVVLVDALSRSGRGGDLSGALSRMLERGARIRVICDEADEAIPGVATRECPGILSPWRRSWAIRGLDAQPLHSGGAVMHVFNRDLADVGLSLAERWSLPYFLTIDEFLAPNERLRVSRKWCKGLIAPNAELADDLIRLVGIPASMIRVIPPGVPRFSPRLKERSPSGEPKISVVGAVATFDEGSGLATFLNAARRVLDAGLDAEFVIAGSGEDEVELRRRTDRLRIADRVTFANEPGPNDAFWSVLDVYCQPSTVPTVGRGLRLALSHGVPSVASDIEGLRWLVEPEVTGLRVASNDTNALAASILELLQPPAPECFVGEGGGVCIWRRHDPDEEVARLLESYAEALDP